MTATPANKAPQPDALSDQALWHRLHTAACTAPIDGAIRRLYQELDSQIRQRGPTCWSSGKCCNFEQYGHRLYVTALEIAWVLAQTERPTAADTSQTPSAGLRGIRDHRGHQEGHPVSLPQITRQASCPFQADRLCTIHSIRPMGCRVFFCQQGTQQWQNCLYETFLAKLHRLHDDLALPYRYLEWRAGLNDAIRHRRPPQAVR